MPLLSVLVVMMKIFITRRMPDGKWYNKMGGSFFIKEMDEHEVFQEEWDCGYLYDGPVVLMAKIEMEVN